MNRIKQVLLGSIDRVLSTVSIFVGLVSLALTVVVYKYPTPLPAYIVIRDVSLLVTLVLIISILSLKYYKKNDLVERFRSLLHSQLVSCHDLSHKFRNHFFCDIRSPMLNDRNFALQIDTISKNYFRKVCHSVLADARDIFLKYFESRGFSIGEDLSITVKSIISCEDAQKILMAMKGARADTLSPHEKYIVTTYRDPYTYEKIPDRREVKEIVYHINECNTAFHEIINNHKEHYFSNDLKKLFDAKKYKNENPQWPQLYNSTLCVPICYKHGTESDSILYYGVLAVDSKNTHVHNLFDDHIALQMMALYADTLAMMLGQIDTMQLFKNIGGQTDAK